MLDSRRARRLASRAAAGPEAQRAARIAPSVIPPAGSSSAEEMTAVAKPRTRAEARTAQRSLPADPQVARPARPASPAVRRTPSASDPARGRRRLTIPAPAVRRAAPASSAVASIPLPTRASLRAASAKLSADLTHNRTAELTLPETSQHGRASQHGQASQRGLSEETGHGRRAVTPHSPLRRAEVGLGRVVSNRRAWGGALAVALVLVIPGASILNKPVATVADDGQFSADIAQAAKQVPGPSTVKPTDSATATAEATARAHRAAKARARATARATAAAKARAEATAAARKTATAAATTTAAKVVRSLAGISGARSGLPYASGLYMPGSSAKNATAFANWRGRGVDVVVDWPARQSWSDIENPDWLLSAWKNTPYTKSFGVAPIPEDGSSSLSSCAAGNNNSHWRTFAQNMKNSGYSNQIVIRLGWEFNGDWYAWKASNPKDFANCWKQIVSTVKPIAPDLRWDWNVNAGPGSSVTDAADAYPGNDYVDIVGIDAYDQYPGVTSEATWATHYSGPYGLKHWLDFAKAHGKPLSIPEWGLYPTRGSNSGGDNPLYIKKMLGFFKDNASNIAYESYFNEPADYYKGAIFDPSLNPKAAAEYKSLLS